MSALPVADDPRDPGAEPAPDLAVVAQLLVDGDAHVLDDWFRPVHLPRYRDLYAVTPSGVLEPVALPGDPR